MTKNAILIAALFTLVLTNYGCKQRRVRTGTGSTVAGVSGDVATRTINYDALFKTAVADQASNAGGQGGRNELATRELVMSNFIAFAGSYENLVSWERAGAGARDAGTIAAYTFLAWVKDQDSRGKLGGKGLFPNGYTISKDEFPGNQGDIRRDRMYHFTAKAPNVPVRYLKDGAVANTTVNITVNVVLGASVLEENNYTIPDTFSSEFSDALLNSDVITYNGHIWAGIYPGGDADNTPLEPDSNTDSIVSKLGGGRSRFGLVYINACKSEKIELKLMNALRGSGADDATRDPMLISHRNFSNYGFFAAHLSRMLTGLVQGQSLPSLVLDMTKASESREEFNVAGRMPDDGQAARGALREYIDRAQTNIKRVLIVAYENLATAGK